MATQNRVGPKRLVVGAHYGLRDWLAQRITAVVMAVYTVFATQWMKLATFVALLCLFYHAWVGIRDIWMDYVKPMGVRLLLQVLTILWLIGCAGYAAQILWRV